MEKLVTTIQGPKVTVNTWQEGMIALNTGEGAGVAVLHKNYKVNNVKSLKYSCSIDSIYDPLTKMLNRMCDGIVNIKVYGNVAKATLRFAPGPSVPLSKISDTEWSLPDFAEDHFLNILGLPFCHDYLDIELERPGSVTITWDCYLLNSKLRRKVSLKMAKPHYTESNTRKFIYSRGTLMNVYDK